MYRLEFEIATIFYIFFKKFYHDHYLPFKNKKTWTFNPSYHPIIQDIPLEGDKY